MQTRDSRGFLPASVLALAIAVLEMLLLRIAGPPSSHLRVLADLASPMAEPLEGVLAALALAAQALGAYLAFALALRTLTHLPGLVGEAANHAERLLTVPAVRRGLDALLGGALLAHLALAPPPAEGGVGTLQPPPAVLSLSTTTALDGRKPWPESVRRTPVRESTAAEPSTSSAASSSVPLPIWLGGDPGPPSVADDPVPLPASGAMVHHTIRSGESLWGIAAAHLPAGTRGEAAIACHWPRIYDANRDALGSDPDLIHPGVTLSLPPGPTKTPDRLP